MSKPTNVEKEFLKVLGVKNLTTIPQYYKELISDFTINGITPKQLDKYIKYNSENGSYGFAGTKSKFINNILKFIKESMAKPTTIEKRFLKAMGFKNTSNISPPVREMIKKLTDADIEPEDMSLIFEKVIKVNGKTFAELSMKGRMNIINETIKAKAERDAEKAQIEDDSEEEYYSEEEELISPNTNKRPKARISEVSDDESEEELLYPIEPYVAEPVENVIQGPDHRLKRDYKIRDSNTRKLAKEQIPNHKELINVNNNLSKMSGLNIKSKTNYGDRFDFMKYAPSTDHFNAEEEKKVFGGKYKAVFNDPKHPYWNKTTRYDAKLEHPNYAAYYANKKGGKAYKGDFNADGIDDIVITGKSGNVSHINGHSMQPSKRGINLQYWASDAYASEPHSYTNKAGKKVLQLTKPSSRKTWIENISNADKRDVNKQLRAAGLQSFKVQDEKAENLLKNNAKIVYDQIKESIVNEYNISKTDLNKSLTSATFASRIINAILLTAGGLLGKGSPQISNADLPFYLNKLKKVFNNDAESKQKILNYGNSMLLAIGESAERIPEFAKAIYNISSKSPSLESYKALAITMSNALKMKSNIGDRSAYYSSIRTQNGALYKRPAPKGQGKKKVPTGEKKGRKPKPKVVLEMLEDMEY